MLAARCSVLASVALFAACASSPRASAPPAGPYVLVLGTAQDAGLPQIGCSEPACAAARRDPTLRRFASSILLCDPRTGSRWLFDAGPDVREQVELARGEPSTRVESGERPALFDGVFLTHAHFGHCAGLLEFGLEAYAAREMPVYASARMGVFL